MLEEQIDFTNPIEFLNYFVDWNAKLKNYIFRGHANESWELLPSALREAERKKIKEILGPSPMYKNDDDSEFFQIQMEFGYIRDFFMKADRQGLRVPSTKFLRENLLSDYDPNMLNILDGVHEWIPQELDDITGLAQHYGLPTRLLDWTYDPFVALHFALKGAIQESGRLCIWCLNKNKLTNHPYTNLKPPIRFITPPYYENPNLNAQKGLFTHIPVRAQGTTGHMSSTIVDRRPLDVILEEKISNEPLINDDKIFKKITLPCEVARITYLALENHGYGVSKMFPGYDGIAKQIIEAHDLRVR